MVSVFGQDPVAADQVKETPAVLLQMMRNDSIHDDLDLAPAARRAIHETLDTIDGPWWRSRLLEVDQRQIEVARLTEALRQMLKMHLSVSQLKRVAELESQALLTKDDQPNIEKMSRQEVLATYGQPFDFTKISRTLPRAPELIDRSNQEAVLVSNWLSDQPKSMGDLRGQVVAVHFYAFECINCVRNLPHYKSWHQDLADEGLVVIGIQTPETSRERELSAVKTAAKESGIAYPLLMDPKSENWNAWGNTMWPTVYLVDKEGYIRTWWQGEMNWQGAKGEQTMRDHIKKLLAE
ncbi:MAG TPA: thioredoxin [Planctomycetaceae bacterium]|nr:thioredoxin [Planctomycetaceae bacterium]